MKRKIFFGIIAFAALAFGSCQDGPVGGEESTQLAIKVYSPTRVLQGQVVTINGTRLDEVTQVVFPGGVPVTDITLLGDGQISVVTPAGVSDGELSVVAGDQAAFAPIPMTVGAPRFNTISFPESPGGPGAWITTELTITGVDLEFIKQAIFPGKEGDLVVGALDFVRKANNMLKIAVPEGIIAGEGKVGLVACNGARLETTEVLFVDKVPGGGGGDVSWKVAWEGNMDCIAAPWAGVGIPAAGFADAAVGSIMRIHHNSVQDGAVLQIYAGDWNPQFAEVSPSADAEYLEMELTESMLNEMLNPEWGSDALVIQGQGCIVTQISYSIPAKETVAWEGNMDCIAAPWAGVGIPTAGFSDAAVGNTMRIYHNSVQDGATLQIYAGDWNPQFAEVSPSADAEYLEMELTESMLNEMKNPEWGSDALVIQGQGCIVTKITYL